MPRRGWTVMPILGRRLGADRLKLGLDLRELFRRPLNLRPLEPVLGRQEPVASGVEEYHADRDDRIVERRHGRARSDLRKDEQDRNESDPDHGDPADDVAPPSEMPRPALEALPR